MAAQSKEFDLEAYLAKVGCSAVLELREPPRLQREHPSYTNDEDNEAFKTRLTALYGKLKCPGHAGGPGGVGDVEQTEGNNDKDLDEEEEQVVEADDEDDKALLEDDPELKQVDAAPTQPGETVDLVMSGGGDKDVEDVEDDKQAKQEH